MGGWSMVRKADKCERVELAKHLINRYWKHLTVLQINRLNRYIQMYG